MIPSFQALICVVLRSWQAETVGVRNYSMTILVRREPEIAAHQNNDHATSPSGRLRSIKLSKTLTLTSSHPERGLCSGEIVGKNRVSDHGRVLEDRQEETASDRADADGRS